MRVSGYYARVWTPVFEGEDDADAGDADDAVAVAAAAAAANDVASGSKFTPEQQTHINKMMAAEKKKHQKTVQKAVEEAQAASKRAQLTAQERSDLDNRLELIQNEMRTKDEQSKRAATKAREAYTAEKTALETDRDSWKNRFTESTIERSITDAAATNNAFSPKQIVAILGRNTQLVPKLNEDGQPTAILEPKVRYNTTDKDGKPVTLDLSPEEAVKRMKDEDEYLNLFRGEGASGAGLRSKPGGKKANVTEIAKDPAAYRAGRKDGSINF